MVALYSVSLFGFLIAGYAQAKTSGLAGAEPLPGTRLHSAYMWFGGGLSTLGIVALLIAGFFTLAWWVPIAALFAGLFSAGALYGLVPLGPTWVFIGFPLGLLTAGAWLFVH